nr:MAG: tail tube protein family protein [Bacteriophage sp.]
MPTTGVYPCYENQFKIDTTGGTGETTNLKTIADMESFSVSIDGNVEEWKPFEHKGWTRRLVTGKSITISVSGKRNVGDPGNDYISGLALKTGSAATTTLVWTFPDGATLTMSGVVSVTEWGSGDSTAVAPLAFDFMSDGEPEFEEASGG